MEIDERAIAKTVERIQEIRTLKSELSAEEGHLVQPFLDDLTLIDSIYEVFLKYLSDNYLACDTNERRKFILVVLFLYSVGSLAGGKMKVGIRDRIAEVTGCTRSLISHNCENLLFQYTHYKDFKDGADEIMRRTLEAIPICTKPFSSGCHAEGYQIMMADKSLKAIERIEEGDYVMGDDWTPRKVIKTHMGNGRLMRIKPMKGTSFYVNEGHVMSLFSVKSHTTIEITALSYFRQTPKTKRDLMLRCGGELVRFEVFRTRRVENYYGITIDGNHLYLDWQGFIHHNLF